MSFWATVLSCCGARPDPSDEADERTALLNPDILPEAPLQPAGRTTEEQLQSQNAVRRILKEAEQKFVTISSPSPFFRPSPYSSPSTSPSSTHHLNEPPNSTGRGSGATIDRRSLWRPSDGPVRVVHLGTNFEPHPSQSHNGANRAPSSHSLRTLARTQGKAREEDSEEGGESRYGTMVSYRTAREGTDTDVKGMTVGRAGGRKVETRGRLEEVWSKQELDGHAEEEARDDEVERKKEEQLAKALEEFEARMEVFTLTAAGPLVEELGDTRAK